MSKIFDILFHILFNKYDAFKGMISTFLLESIHYGAKFIFLAPKI